MTREDRQAGSSVDSAHDAFSRLGGLRPALVGLIRGDPIRAPAVTALLVDLSNRGHLQLRRADASESPWVLERGRGTTGGAPRPRVRLAFYEKAVLRRLFWGRRRAMWLSDLPTRRAALQRTYRRLERKARKAVQEDLSLRQLVRDFREKLQGVKPKSLDHETRRDYLPYVLAYSLYHHWEFWGMRPPFRLPKAAEAPPPGTRPEPGPGGDVEHQPSVVADVLYATIYPIFDDIQRRERHREYRKQDHPHREWRDPPF